MNIILLIILTCVLFQESVFSKDLCEEVQYDIAHEEVKNLKNMQLQDYFISHYQDYNQKTEMKFKASHKICKDRLNNVKEAEVECSYLNDKSKYSKLMNYKYIEKKFINSIKNCRELKVKKNKMASYYESENTNPMDLYKTIVLNSCLATVAPILFVAPTWFYSKVKYCTKLTNDLFEIVAPKCATGDNAKIIGSNPCTALYDHISDEIVKKPHFDKIIKKFIYTFSKYSKKEIGNDFYDHLNEIGMGNIKDALLVLSLFSSNVTIPRIKEKLYNAKEFQRLNELSFLLDFRVDRMLKSFIPIYYGDQHIKIKNHLITDSRKYHFFAALYIGCELKAKKHSNFIVRFLTGIIGHTYEIKDFIGHYFYDGSSFDLSYRNFKVDSNKYLLGGRIATEICQ